MSKVRIVGGGVLGAAAALEAHRLGAREIVLHAPSCVVAPLVDGLELREDCILFGDSDDPLRRLLEWNGAPFESFELACGSLHATARGEATALHGFSAPDAPGVTPGARAETLHQRLHALPESFAAQLTAYSQRRLRAWLDRVDASAADMLGLDEAVTPGVGSQAVSLPRGGFRALAVALRRALDNLGVEWVDAQPPRRPARLNQHEVLVWTADPELLLPGGSRPFTTPDRTVSHVFRARFAGPRPFVVRNYSAAGSVFALYVYETRGETLVSAVCVQDATECAVRAEAQAMLDAFSGEPARVGEHLAARSRTRGLALTLEARRCLEDVARRNGPAFVGGAWTRATLSARFAEVSQGLAHALGQAQPRISAA